MVIIEGRVTTDPGFIWDWVEARKGHPALTKRIRDSEVSSVLQIHFKELTTDCPEKISWDTFFEKFQQEKLVFTYEEKSTDGELSCHCELL